MTALPNTVSSMCAVRSGGRGGGRRRLALALAAATISGCISVPFPLASGPLPDSRMNIPAQIPSAIAIGHTSRREVLLELGEPDGIGPNDAWYSYGSAFSHGGLGILTVSYGGSYDARHNVEVRRLFLKFDSSGVVSSVNLETKRCPMWTSDLLRHVSLPCLDIQGADVARQESSPLPSSRLGQFNYVTRRPGDCSTHGKLTAEGAVGTLEIFADVMLLAPTPGEQKEYSAYLNPAPADSLKIPLEGVQSVQYVKGRWFWKWLNVRMKDGTCFSLQFGKEGQAQEAAQLIRRQSGAR